MIFSVKNSIYKYGRITLIRTDSRFNKKRKKK